MKICTKCHKKIKIINFRKGNDEDGKTYWCKPCFLDYYYSHKEQKKIHDKTYRRKHRNEINKKNKLRCRTNINYRLAHTLRIRVWKVLKGINKSKSTLELLGCSIEQLKDHLEKQFTEGMSFNNYGKWHIDHKRPCASFNLSKKSEQRKCFHYTNLQPLWAEDNIRKH